MPAPAHVQATTIENFVDGWKRLTAESWTSLWSPDCTQQFLPFSLKMEPHDRFEAVERLPLILSMLKNWKLDVHQIVHDAPKSKAVIYAISDADTPFENFRWTNEYAVFISLTEDGQKINKVQEMVDTAFFKEFLARFEKYMMKQAGAA